MEPNLLQYAFQYDMAVGAFAKNQIAEQAVQYTVQWISEHPEAIDQEARIVDQLRKFKMDDPTRLSKIREAINNLKIIRNACAARDIKNSVPNGTNYRTFMDYMRQTWAGMRVNMSSMGTNFMRFSSSVGRSAKEIGAGIVGFMAGMASEAGTWITAMLAQNGLTVAGVLGGIAALAVIFVLLFIAHHYFTRNKPFKGDALLESYGSHPTIPYRPQQI